MIYMLDTANIESIARLIDIFPIEGVTTNPTIVSRAKKPIKTLMQEIRLIIGKDLMLHVQTISETAEDMVKEALLLRDIDDGNFYAKIPANQQGIKAIQILKKRGLNVTATAIFTPQQGLVAAKAGADFIAPYVNRLDNISSHGIDVVSDLVFLMDKFHLSTKVLAASFKNVDQIYRVSMAGSHSITIEPGLLETMVSHPLLDISIHDFIKDGTPYYQDLFTSKSGSK
jgi:fructose-6-phosphate aldolase 2